MFCVSLLSPMKNTTRALLAFLTLPTAIALSPLPSLSLPLPHINEGESYGELRKELLELGWQPHILDPVDNSPFVQDLKAQGWSEIHACSGTGLGLCAFIFQDSLGNSLSISTYNNYPGLAESEADRFLIYGWSYQENNNETTSE